MCIAGCKQVENLETELMQKDRLNQGLQIKLQQLNSIRDEVIGFQKHAEALETQVSGGVLMKQVQENKNMERNRGSSAKKYTERRCEGQVGICN